MSEIVYKEESYRIIGACFEVYNWMGCGFLEPVYQECLEVEFRTQQIPSVAQPELELNYRDQKLTKTYIPDFVCFSKIIVEIKSLDQFADKHRAQVLNYLNVTSFQLGLLINFGSHPKLTYERFALSH